MFKKVFLIVLCLLFVGCGIVYIEQEVEIDNFDNSAYEVSTRVRVNVWGSYNPSKHRQYETVPCEKVKETKERQMRVAIEHRKIIKETLKRLKECETK